MHVSGPEPHCCAARFPLHCATMSMRSVWRPARPRSPWRSAPPACASRIRAPPRHSRWSLHAIEAWLGLAAAHHGLDQHDLAAQDLRALLSRHGHARGPDNVRLHDMIALAHGDAGCCTLSADGRLRVTLLDRAANMNRAVILLDGVPLGVRPRRCARDNERLRALFLLPGGWRHATQIAVCLKGCHLLGSPLDASAIGQVEGFVTAASGGLTGWAWFPRDPDCTPLLAIQDANVSPSAIRRPRYAMPGRSPARAA